VLFSTTYLLTTHKTTHFYGLLVGSKISPHLRINIYLPSSLPIFLPSNLYMRSRLQNWLPMSNQILTQLRFHPQVSNIGHPVNGVLVGAGSLWPIWFHILRNVET